MSKKIISKITGSIFQRTPENLDRIIKLCKEIHSIKLSTMLFRMQKKLEEILEICDEYNLEYKDGMFKRNPIEDIEKY